MLVDAYMYAEACNWLVQSYLGDVTLVGHVLSDD